MQRKSIRYTLWGLLILCCSFISVDNSETKRSVFSKEAIKSDLGSLEELIEVRVNENVKHFIGSYLTRGKASTGYILGRASMYFPIIEDNLGKYNLPNELKYLAVIESALKPKITSSVGAKGVWQLMPATARKYGIKINHHIDERMDVHLSTEVAMKFLSNLHQRYDDWALAIAAYNCGPGRVDKVIRKMGSSDYWKISKGLPKQTQRYVEKFIAVNYALDNYLFHNIHPKYPDYDLMMTEKRTVYQRYSFKQISEITGISELIISRLNPAYIQKVIPANEKGNNLVLPLIGVDDHSLATLR